MNTTGRWLARAGAIIIVVGFFLPSLAVSCTVLPDVPSLPGLSALSSLGNWSVTLNQIAQAGQQPLLYLVPLGALAVLVLAFLSGRTSAEVRGFLAGQVAGVAAGALGIVVAFLLMYSQFQQSIFSSAFTIAPDVGLFVLALGYGLVAAGIVMQYSDLGAARGYEYNPPPYEPRPAPTDWRRRPDEGGGGRPAPRIPKVSAWLVTSDGRNYQLNQGVTRIGRSSRNDIVLSGDTTMSREHAKIIEDNGHFKLVDLGSKSGTRVNGRLVREQMMIEGDDELQFGDGMVAHFVTSRR